MPLARYGVKTRCCGIGAGSFIATFLLVIALTRPNVPWDALQYGAPVVLALSMVLFYPVAKVVWLVVDVMMRPVTRAELE